MNRLNNKYEITTNDTSIYGFPRNYIMNNDSITRESKEAKSTMEIINKSIEICQGTFEGETSHRFHDRLSLPLELKIILDTNEVKRNESSGDGTSNRHGSRATIFAPDVIRWSPDGNSFIVANEDDFTRKYLPLSFLDSDLNILEATNISQAKTFQEFHDHLCRRGFTSERISQSSDGNRTTGPDVQHVYSRSDFARDSTSSANARRR